MPLDTSSYSLALLRTDGRRWNELRRVNAQISTHDGADGSSYLEMGNTKVICIVSGPEELKNSGGGGGGGGARSGQQQQSGNEARVECVVNVAAFGGVDRKKRSRGDKRTTDLSHTISSAFQPLLHTHLPPTTTITLTLHILSSDGSLLATCLNAATLALISAGIPLVHYLTACTAGSTASYESNNDDGSNAADPLLDLNGSEEGELPFLTVGTVGGGEGVSVLVMETRGRVEGVEEMVRVGLDGCRSLLGMLDGVVREHGRRVLEGLP